MARRQLQEIDASSIADIAFIMLAFIIIITTLQREEGIPAVLPQKRDSAITPPPVKEKNVLKIMVNKQDRIMIEDEWDQGLEDIAPAVVEFMTNPRNLDNMPTLDVITREKCNTKILTLKANLDGEPDLIRKGFIEDDIKKWEKKLEAVKLLGSYKTLPSAATIAIQYDRGTTYGAYIRVRDEIMGGINQLRNEICISKFGMPFNVLLSKREEVKTDEDKAMIRAIREAFPQKVIKLPPRNAE